MSVRGPQQKVGGRFDIKRGSKGIFILVEDLAIMPVHSVVTVAELGRQPTSEIIASLEANTIFRIGEEVISKALGRLRYRDGRILAAKKPGCCCCLSHNSDRRP